MSASLDTSTNSPSAGGEPIVQLDQLHVRYGDFEALRGVSLDLPTGAIGLVGRNGAGKSTLMRLMLGLIAPSAGSGRVLGVDLRAQGSRLRQTVGYMPENDAFLLGMRGLEQVALAARCADSDNGSRFVEPMRC